MSAFHIWGAVKWKPNTRYKVTMEFVLIKIFARSVNSFIPLGDKTINSSLVERGKWLMDSQPHPLLQFLVRMKPTSTNIFLQVAKNVQVIRGKISAVRRILKCIPTISLIPHQIGSMGTGVIMQKDDSVGQHYRAFWLYRVFQHPQPPRNVPHLSVLLCFSAFTMLYIRTLYYHHLQRN